jgi:iron complex outermembrane receptor protein
LDNQGVLILDQALRCTPGVKTDPNGADIRFDGNVYIRGFLANQYLDGLKLFRGALTAPAVEPWLLERSTSCMGQARRCMGRPRTAGSLT